VIITSQYKAWNDTARMCMWIDLIAAPLVNQLGTILVWSDNCSCHVTNAVNQMYQQHGILHPYYPPNMTSKLQVIDLVVNGPIKQKVRSFRAKSMVEELEAYNERYQAEQLKPEAERKTITFTPPKPELSLSMALLLSMLEKDFQTDNFKEGIRRAFLSTGSYHDGKGTFKEYTHATNNEQGMMKFAPSNARPYVQPPSPPAATAPPNHVPQQQNTISEFEEETAILTEDEITNDTTTASSVEGTIEAQQQQAQTMIDQMYQHMDELLEEEECEDDERMDESGNEWDDYEESDNEDEEEINEEQ